jgi:hypothetical protein
MTSVFVLLRCQRLLYILKLFVQTEFRIFKKIMAAAGLCFCYYRLLSFYDHYNIFNVFFVLKICHVEAFYNFILFELLSFGVIV